MMETLRDIQLRIHLAGGHEQTVTLREDAPELLAMFTALSAVAPEDRMVQLPLDGGRTACSFRTSQIVSIVSDPPVVMVVDKIPDVQKAAGPSHPTRVRRPRFTIIDDFLGAQEHRELLAFALASEDAFKAGSVTSYDPETRQNLVILTFGESVHSRLIQSRLLMWFPLLAKTFGIPVFPLATVESQLTAAGTGHYFKVHSDDGPQCPRVLSSVYYLHREPRGFAGGDLRLYDCVETDGSRRPADTFTTVDPVANRLVVFPSAEFHEAMPVRCPSKEFADNRFAVTTWLHRAARPDPVAAFGWGHFHCGVVAPQFAATRRASGAVS